MNTFAKSITISITNIMYIYVCSSSTPERINPVPTIANPAIDKLAITFPINCSSFLIAFPPTKKHTKAIKLIKTFKIKPIFHSTFYIVITILY
ncbi:membrane protein [Listeria monocytogenes]|nr:membrane protein [Listeria monocytogenes]